VGSVKITVILQVIPNDFVKKMKCGVCKDNFYIASDPYQYFEENAM
jgi:hypothetical protein